MLNYKHVMRWMLWLVSLALIVALTTMPWRDYVGHSHWDRVRWVPFSDHGFPEILLNVALFFPFGYCFRQALHGHFWKKIGVSRSS